MNTKYAKIICAISIAGAITSGCTGSVSELETPPETSPETTIAKETPSPNAADQQRNEIFEEIGNAEYPYIGDASAVGSLIGHLKQLYAIETESTMELQTECLPYNLTLHFAAEPDNLSMQRLSVIVLNLVNNCYSVSWDYPLNDAGDKAYFYLPMSATFDFFKTPYSQRSGSGAEKVEELYEELNDTVKEIYPARKRSETLDEAVSAVVFEYNQGVYGDENEVAGEGHIIMDSKEEDKTVTVYAMTMYGEYQFQNGNFVKNGGSGAVPAAIRFAKEPDGSYVTLHYQYPADGVMYIDSVHEMFPESLWERCISFSDTDNQELKMQEQAYARAYLSEIGRTAAVGDFGDFEYVVPSDAGISVEVSNKLGIDRQSGVPEAERHAPFWLGNIEILEDGIRYIYEHTYDAETREIRYSKINYDSGEVMASTIYDSISGERKESMNYMETPALQEAIPAS